MANSSRLLQKQELTDLIKTKRQDDRAFSDMKSWKAAQVKAHYNDHLNQKRADLFGKYQKTTQESLNRAH